MSLPEKNRVSSELITYFENDLEEERRKLGTRWASESVFPVVYLEDLVAETLKEDLGIVRDEERLLNGLKDVDYYLSVVEKLKYDKSEMPYLGFSVAGILTLAKAALTCALFRKESRGAHYRSDYPETKEEWQAATIISCDDGKFNVRLDSENAYES